MTPAIQPKKVIQLRASLGDDVLDFARRYGVDRATVYRWEKIGVSRKGTAKHVIGQAIQAMQDKMAARKVAAE
jgi:DNA-binding transcriptional regulator YiaG